LFIISVLFVLKTRNKKSSAQIGSLQQLALVVRSSKVM
jgi:hypothetical protein